MSDTIKELVESVNRLAATDPAGPEVEERARAVFQATRSLVASKTRSASPDRDVAPSKKEFVVDNPSVLDQIDKMRSAAAAPAESYNRVLSILDGLRHAAVLAERPQNVAVRPRIAEIVKKVAGIFAEVDTVQDLDKPLEQIEKAVHALYGDQSKNSTLYFERRGKGHHGESAE